MLNSERTTSERLQAIGGTFVAIVGAVQEWVAPKLFGIAVFLVVVGCVMVAVWFYSQILYISSPDGRQNQAALEFQQRDRIVQACLEFEQYTRDECISLAGQK